MFGCDVGCSACSEWNSNIDDCLARNQYGQIQRASLADHTQVNTLLRVQYLAEHNIAAAAA